MGHEPITKMTLASGPETVREVGADALLVDLQRPDEDAYGVRIIEELRNDPRTSEYRSSSVRELPRRYGHSFAALISWACRCVIKPFEVSELEETLTAALKGPKPASAAPDADLADQRAPCRGALPPGLTGPARRPHRVDRLLPRTDQEVVRLVVENVLHDHRAGCIGDRSSDRKPRALGVGEGVAPCCRGGMPGLLVLDRKPVPGRCSARMQSAPAVPRPTPG